jgi:hypothetical protein
MCKVLFTRLLHNVQCLKKLTAVRAIRKAGCIPVEFKTRLPLANFCLETFCRENCLFQMYTSKVKCYSRVKGNVETDDLPQAQNHPFLHVIVNNVFYIFFLFVGPLS